MVRRGGDHPGVGTGHRRTDAVDRRRHPAAAVLLRGRRLDAAGGAERVGAAVPVDVFRRAHGGAALGRGPAVVRAERRRALGRRQRRIAGCALAAARLLRPGSADVHAADGVGGVGGVCAVAGDGGWTIAQHPCGTNDGRPKSALIFDPSSFVTRMVGRLCAGRRCHALHALLRHLPAAGVWNLLAGRLAHCTAPQPRGCHAEPVHGSRPATANDQRSISGGCAWGRPFARIGGFFGFCPCDRCALSSVVARAAQPVSGGSFLLAGRAQAE